MKGQEQNAVRMEKPKMSENSRKREHRGIVIMKSHDAKPKWTKGSPPKYPSVGGRQSVQLL